MNQNRTVSPTPAEAAYIEFLRRKIATAPRAGFDVDPNDLHPSLPLGTRPPDDGGWAA